VLRSETFGACAKFSLRLIVGRAAHTTLFNINFAVRAFMAKIDTDKLLSSVNIDDVAKRLGLELKAESSSRYMAKCPFHNDKTASLLIDTSRNQGRQHYHCFGCGVNGDAIELVKELLGLEFRQAIDWLASAYSVQMDRGSGGKSPVRSSTKNLSSGLDLAMTQYKKNNESGRLDEWAERRSISLASYQQAGVLFSKHQTLSAWLSKLRDPYEGRTAAALLEEAGLVRKVRSRTAASLDLPLSDAGIGQNLYKDAFTGDRIIFPLLNEQKKLVGLAGRAVSSMPSSGPKYLFTKGFRKGEILYRADVAFSKLKCDAKAGEVNLNLYLCEGFMDALRLESYGLAAVATMGASLSGKQIQLLKDLNDSLAKEATLTTFVCFDRDEAGLRGAADTILKLLGRRLDVRFVWPVLHDIRAVNPGRPSYKDPDDYLSGLSSELALDIIDRSSFAPGIGVLSNFFAVSAETVLVNENWETAPRSKKYRAIARAKNALTDAVGFDASTLRQLIGTGSTLSAAKDWLSFLSEDTLTQSSLSEFFLVDSDARINHARVLAYMGSRRGELPCDEPAWERLDIAATAFNLLIMDKIRNADAGQVGAADAVWVPRSFGGAEPRLKMMPRPEDLIHQQYLMNEVLTERWDGAAYGVSPFSNRIPAVRYYREARQTITTGFVSGGHAAPRRLDRTVPLSFAYQIDMDVLEGRQPASDQGMYRPFHECWRDFMSSIKAQATEIGFVYTLRLDVARYYDRLRRYVVRDSIQNSIELALESVAGDTPKFCELIDFDASDSSSAKAAIVVDNICEQLYGLRYLLPDSGREVAADPVCGIPQGPVLSAWIGSVALFPLDAAALELMEKYNVDGKVRIGYARYVDDIVLLAESTSLLDELRDVLSSKARGLELSLLAKAGKIPPMTSEEFSIYANQGRALEVSGLAWEAPLVGDGESGWGFWANVVESDRQSALQLLHDVELYKASPESIVQTVRTAFLAPDLRASELAKAARLLWYAVASKILGDSSAVTLDSHEAWDEYYKYWNLCTTGSPWKLNPEKNSWEAPTLFALEGLERLVDVKNSDLRELTASENISRRARTAALARMVVSNEFAGQQSDGSYLPLRQYVQRIELLKWKSRRTLNIEYPHLGVADAELSQLVESWRPFSWLHATVQLLTQGGPNGEDPLNPLIAPFSIKTRNLSKTLGIQFFEALFPIQYSKASPPDVNITGIALQTLVTLVPRNELLNCLSRRPHILDFGRSESSSPSVLIFPPLPGINMARLLVCRAAENEGGRKLISELSAIELVEEGRSLFPLTFLGICSDGFVSLNPDWRASDIAGANGVLKKLDAPLVDEDRLLLRGREVGNTNALRAADLKSAAGLFRSLASLVEKYERDFEGLSLVPAWPYIATDLTGEKTFLLCEGVSKHKIGNSAFVKDGGRALRTIEVPIFGAGFWRVGMAVTDYLGLHDDIAKYGSISEDVPFDALALSDPARHVLRSQLRKLRGAFSTSNFGRWIKDGERFPGTIERALVLLEQYPSDEEGHDMQLMHVLATEAETSAMHIALNDQSLKRGVLGFLTEVTERVLGRLPLSLAKNLAHAPEAVDDVRRDVVGLLCLANRLAVVKSDSRLRSLVSWNVLCAAVACTGVAVALDGFLATLRSHPDFERNDRFDFPVEWCIAQDDRMPRDPVKGAALLPMDCEVNLLGKLRQIVQHLGHRLGTEAPGNSISPSAEEAIREVAVVLSKIDWLSHDESAEKFDWPFDKLTKEDIACLDVELLRKVVFLVKQLDSELGFDVVFVKAYSYGFNAKTRRFTDSRGRSWETNPWMISQFPRRAKHVEEHAHGGEVFRIWSEVYDRNSGRLLSVSVLGEPFAAISVKKEDAGVVAATNEAEQLEGAALSAKDQRDRLVNDEAGPNAGAINESTDLAVPKEPAERFDSNLPASIGTNDSVKINSAKISDFRRRQSDAWSVRAGPGKNLAHVRVAILQIDVGVSYLHPMVETAPNCWPFSEKNKMEICRHLRGNTTYASLLEATAGAGRAHIWRGHGVTSVQLPSWEEHRRRRILERAIDACETFRVDLLVLPEYSMRQETVVWLKEFLAKKRVSVLAGTYMNFEAGVGGERLSAQMNLLWPIPDELAVLFSSNLSEKTGFSEGSQAGDIDRGLVLQLSRSKKYRSVGLNEFIRPGTQPLAPLFIPIDLSAEILKQYSKVLDGRALTKLLAGTRLPLKYFLELICSEVFLATNPANYKNMARDYVEMRRRFGEVGEEAEVWNDLANISNLMVIGGGDGISDRRSVVVVPAATTRSADYWIVGQAGQLAAGITTVFCNGVGKGLAGGSCVIGRDSWKSAENAIGYVQSSTPYHGWSKGIYYSSSQDPLSKDDQALVIVDIDPHNMLEGKPRPQMLPPPLQLVAYLPLVETADLQALTNNLYQSLPVPTDLVGKEKIKARRLAEKSEFWAAISHANTEFGVGGFAEVSGFFSDADSVRSRSQCYWDNGGMQPSASASSKGVFSSPAFYDWLDVDLSLGENEVLPPLSVPSWLSKPD